jgi:hypothetical protein
MRGGVAEHIVDGRAAASQNRNSDLHDVSPDGNPGFAFANKAITAAIRCSSLIVTFNVLLVAGPSSRMPPKCRRIVCSARTLSCSSICLTDTRSS